MKPIGAVEGISRKEATERGWSEWAKDNGTGGAKQGEGLRGQQRGGSWEGKTNTKNIWKKLYGSLPL